ncbi:hypothetical protein PC128_g24559 [Phytophthora cactorum]|nr:hypothetical protein PC128_g24559 [Phytophthora cactorum]
MNIMLTLLQVEELSPRPELVLRRLTRLSELLLKLRVCAETRSACEPASIRPDPRSSRLPIGYNGVVLSFDGSAKTETHGGYGSCSWILWRLPEWTIVTAASAFLESTTVNVTEYTGMSQGVKAAIDNNIDELIIVGDSRLAIQQSLGVIACRKETLQTQLNNHKELTAKLRSVR